MGRFSLFHRGSSLVEHVYGGKQDECEHDIERRSHDENMKPLPAGLVVEVRRIGGVGFFGIFAKESYIPLEREHRDPILSLLPYLDRGVFSESDREDFHFYAEEFGKKEMARFVDHDEDSSTMAMASMLPRKGRLNGFTIYLHSCVLFDSGIELDDGRDGLQTMCRWWYRELSR
ncbi:MAG: hypothetical protein MZV63_63620 [Marinilabiliales bacterium]|nr:hypothetical protein [Marinilabiliales bacterium]